MKRSVRSVLMGVFILGAIVSQARAKDILYDKERINVRRSEPKKVSSGTEFANLFLPTAVDTYCVVKYDFNPMNWQGWEQVDNTQQVDTFFHVDDFSDLGGGDFGRLIPLEGAQSMWCGTRGDEFDPYMCSWISPPGYGDDWIQILVSDTIFFDGEMTFSYKISYDCEPQFDFVYVEYETSGGLWTQLAQYDSIGSESVSHEFNCPGYTRIRFRFESDVFFSDRDDEYNSDGAVIVDSLVIHGLPSTPIDFEDFESAALMDRETDGDLNGFCWHADIPPAFGKYSGLADNLCDQDPCNENVSAQIAFFTGSTVYSTYCVPDTPPGITLPDGSMLYQNEMVISPPIDLNLYSTGYDETQGAVIPPSDLAELAGCVVRYTMYGDLPLANCVYYTVLVRAIDPSGCPGPWENDNRVWYTKDKEYIFGELDISHRLPTDDTIQIALRCWDACDLFFPGTCTCASHTPSPWFDNVGVYRYTQVGPQWSYDWIDLFQDNFPSDAINLESWVRADMAIDGNPSGPAIIPNDHIAVKCISPYYGGIAEDPNGPRVYMHVKCEYIGSLSPPHGPKPQYLFGPSLEGSYGDYTRDDGAIWTTIQATDPTLADPDEYWFDLNDSLFTRGYMISYYFEAYDNYDHRTTLPENAEVLAEKQYECSTNNYYPGVSYIFEFTCLPTMTSDILYVDDYHGIGTFWGEVEQYFNPTFCAVIPSENLPDRYDVNGPDKKASNGPGSRAYWEQLAQAYRKIIWDSGDLDVATICDGTAASDKSNDQLLLQDWLNFSGFNAGLWICGDNIAYDMSVNMGILIGGALFGTCGVTYLGDDYYAVTGEASPLISPTTTGIFWYENLQFYAFGGCPTINRFDLLGRILSPTFNGVLSLAYPSNATAGVQSEWIPVPGERAIRTMWWGFSFMYVRNSVDAAPIIRNELMNEIFVWMENGTNEDITGDETPDLFSSFLEQNYPNPFNPSTKISFGLDVATHVFLRIYDPSGKQVRTLVDEHRVPGEYDELWDGKNEKGTPVASGIYFYRLTTGERTRTKKMVLLR